MEQPCLFDYATSELSQDAFFAWLLAWADKRYQGAEHDLALLFLRTIFKKAATSYSLPHEFSIDVYRQYGHIDVFCTINGNECAVILEDKVYTRDHDKQLERYLENVIGENKYQNVAGVYCKTGDQSSYSAIEELGYVVMNRSELLKLLESDEGCRACKCNLIVGDFARHLKYMDELVNGYRSKPVKDWDGNAWKGFYMALQKELDDGEWDYVSNPAGGFMGFWWHFMHIEDDKAWTYLQLEEEKACFKVECGDLNPEALKWKWHVRITDAARTIGVNARKPNVMRKGYWMTVAVLEGGYMVKREDGVLDFSTTVSKIREMERVMKETVASQGKGELAE